MHLFQFTLLSCLIEASQSFAPNLELSKQRTAELFGGIGVAKTYSWKEDQYEIELKVKVPKETTARQIKYTPKSRSIHLALGEEVLLDGSRQMRNLIDLDGTFWSIIDSEEHDGRDVVITIEKMILPPNDPFEVVEFDWNGIYPNDDDEIIEKKYDEAEALDVREYAASLGVDIDNIDMSKVDKSMFNSGLNMTRSTLDELTNAGYVSEVTRQGDGTELLDQGDGKTAPFNAFGDNVGKDEIEAAGIRMDEIPKPTQANPYMTKDSPWLQTMPAEEARTGEENGIESEEAPASAKKEDSDGKKKMEMKDPIDLLTVSKLKEILKREELKVSGNKKELQDRLKNHVKSVAKKNKNDGGWQ
jgi:hypothetical protein